MFVKANNIDNFKEEFGMEENMKENAEEFECSHSCHECEGCGHDMEDFDDDENGILTFVDDDGKDVRFEILDVVTMDEKEYLVVLPIDDEDAGVLILEIKQEDGEEVYDTVTDEEEAEKVFQKFQEEYGDDEEFEEDEDEE